MRIERIVSKIVWIVTVIFFLSGGTRLMAQSNGEWTYGFIDGGSISALTEESPSGTTVYAATAGGIFKTTDSGETWKFLTNSPAQVERLAYDTQKSILYAANIYSVWKSADGGATWAQVYQSPITPEDVAGLYAKLVGLVAGNGSVYIANNNTYEGAAGPLVVSTDAGGTWKAMAPLLPSSTLNSSLNAEMHAYSIYDLVMDSADTLYILSCNNNPIVAGNMTTTFCFELSMPEEVYASYQGVGELWSQVGTSESLNVTFANVFTERDATGVIYATDGGNVFQYLCTAESKCGWTMDPATVSVNNMLVDGCLNYQMLAGTPQGVAAHPFGSASDWSQYGYAQGLGNGQTSLNVGPMALHCGGGLFAGLDGGVWLSTDLGATWTEKNSGLAGADVNTIAVANDSTHTVYAGTSANGIFKSADGGATWTPSNKGLEMISPATNQDPATATPLPVKSIAIDSRNPLNMFAAAGGGLFRSTDGGANWTAVPSPFDINTPWYDFVAVAVDPTKAGKVYAFAYLGALMVESLDGGQTWAKVAGPSYMHSGNSVALSPTTFPMYSADQVGIEMLAADGQKWKTLLPGYAFAVAVDPNASKTIYASSINGLSKSTDGGATWKTLASNPAGNIYGIFVDSSSTVYIAANTATAFNPTGTNLTYMAAPGGVWSSADGGATWTSLNVMAGRSVNSVEHDTATGNVYAGLQGLGVGVYAKPAANQPVLSISKSALSFTAVAAGDDPAPQSFTIENTGTGNLVWSASSGGSWDALSQTSGTIAAGASTTISVKPSTSSLAVGHFSDSIVVTATGATNSPFTISVSLAVNAATTQTSLSANPRTAAIGLRVVFTAAVSTTGNKTPTGSITFLNGAAPMGSATLSSGTATFATSSLSLGANSITASFAGDDYNAASVSPAYIETITGTSAAAPGFTPAGGTYSTEQFVKLSTATPGATIYFTTDGSTPTYSSAVYAAPIAVTTTETINTIAGGAGFAQSTVASATYTMTPGLSAFIPVNGGVVIANPGQSGLATISIVPVGGFSGQVDLTCTLTLSPSTADAAYDPTCSFGSSSLSFTGAGPQIAVMTINSSAATTSFATPADRRNGSTLEMAGGLGLAAMLLGIFLPARRRWTSILGVPAILLACLLSAATGCGGGGTNSGGGGGSKTTPGTTVGSYTFTVTVQDHATGKTAATVAVPVSVQ